jgi:hypothetical protein
MKTIEELKHELENVKYIYSKSNLFDESLKIRELEREIFIIEKQEELVSQAIEIAEGRSLYMPNIDHLKALLNLLKETNVIYGGV